MPKFEQSRSFLIFDLLVASAWYWINTILFDSIILFTFSDAKMSSHKFFFLSLSKGFSSLGVSQLFFSLFKGLSRLCLRKRVHLRVPHFSLSHLLSVAFFRSHTRLYSPSLRRFFFLNISSALPIRHVI